LAFLVGGRITFRRLVVVGLVATSVSIAVTVAVYSWFWRRLIWPELDVFLFKVVENRSSEWGTSPAHAYLTALLPQALLAAALCLPFSIAIASFGGRINRQYLPTAQGVRFIFPALMPLNALAALTIRRIQRRAERADGRRRRDLLAVWAVRASLVSSFAVSVLLLYVSSLNYPGGVALARLNGIVAQHGERVHIDNLAATTGVTRFADDGRLQIDKTEGVADADLDHDYLIHPHAHVAGYTLVDTVRAFTRLERTRWPPFINVVVDDQLFTLKRNNTTTMT
jgi:alpha-1,6-mannosyltransferase